jgi:hypothetical protein
MIGTIKPIPTEYAGCRFRSRLEARWAVYLDAMGLRWVYEPEVFDLGDGVRYLPDFWLPDVVMFAEAKPVTLTDAEMDKAERLAVHTGHGVVLLVGTPEPHSYWCVFARADGTVEMEDAIIDGDYLFENRFYTSTGVDPEESNYVYRGDIMQAVNASRSARFENSVFGGTS